MTEKIIDVVLLKIYWYIGISMGRVSKKNINQKLQIELEEQLSFIIQSLTNKAEVSSFLNEFLTIEERIMLGKRLVLYMMLYRNFSSSQIHAALSMSYETIRWYKEIFRNKSEVFKNTVERLIKREKSQEFWKKIEKILEPFALALSAKTNMKARAKLASGDFWKNE